MDPNLKAALARAVALQPTDATTWDGKPRPWGIPIVPAPGERFGHFLAPARRVSAIRTDFRVLVVDVLSQRDTTAPRART